MKNKPLSFLAAAMVLAASALGANTALAHGAAEPQHGGVVQSAADLSFELVATADGATIYVIDHDDDYDASGLSGKLTVLNGSEKSEAELKPAGGNKLEAKGVKLGTGAKVVAALNTGSRKTITVRFAVK
ncbi:hypothetical protein [Pigmentiphaga sp.]|uniref:hypothetical protein n=1 Tax=Pigmentiphaga sp. TaxID=1977564 RepID=UPI0025E2E404|nr:hypothetical protein [Pigmentiphaga sp.]